jgi:hypothetical protein
MAEFYLLFFIESFGDWSVQSSEPLWAWSLNSSSHRLLLQPIQWLIQKSCLWLWVQALQVAYHLSSQVVCY